MGMGLVQKAKHLPTGAKHELLKAVANLREVQNLMSRDDIAFIQRAASQDAEIALQKKGSDSDTGNTTEETTGGKGTDMEEATGGKGGGSNTTTTAPTTASPTTAPFPGLSLCPDDVAEDDCVDFRN